MTPHQFAHDILKVRLHASEIHEGYNFHFGHKASGNIQTLRELGRDMGFEVHDYPEMRLRGRKKPFPAATSGTSCAKGESVGHDIYWRGHSAILSTAGRGRGYGSKYTVPTINLAALRGNSAERWRLHHPHTRWQRCFDSVTNVGNRPTFGADSFAVESHLMNFHPLEVTAETEVEMHFLDRLRDEIKFPSVEALREQIGRDVGKSAEVLLPEGETRNCRLLISDC